MKTFKQFCEDDHASTLAAYKAKLKQDQSPEATRAGMQHRAAQATEAKVQYHAACNHMEALRQKLLAEPDKAKKKLVRHEMDIYSYNVFGPAQKAHQNHEMRQGRHGPLG